MSPSPPRRGPGPPQQALTTPCPRSGQSAEPPREWGSNHAGVGLRPACTPGHGPVGLPELLLLEWTRLGGPDQVSQLKAGRSPSPVPRGGTEKLPLMTTPSFPGVSWLPPCGPKGSALLLRPCLLLPSSPSEHRPPPPSQFHGRHRSEKPSFFRRWRAEGPRRLWSQGGRWVPPNVPGAASSAPDSSPTWSPQPPTPADPRWAPTLVEGVLLVEVQV